MIDERLLAWARYLYWCDLMRQKWDTYMSQHGGDGEDFAEWLGLTSYWYSSLFVVVEGWESNQFKDGVIDRLLNHPAGYRDLLRRYRNTVFHYQPSLNESRMLNFMARKEEHLFWTFTLHSEFCRFFRDWVDTFPGTAEQKAEFVNDIRSVVGFIPSKPAEERINELLKTAAVAEKIVANAKDTSVEELKDALDGVQRAIQHSREIASRERLERLFRLGSLAGNPEQ